MIKRVAFFADKKNIENYFELTTRKENLFEPHYNISPGHHIPVVVDKDGEPEIKRVRWGSEVNGQSDQSSISDENLTEQLSKKGTKRCIIPLSGFFVWKESREKEHPFFVRMLNKPFMSVAGLYHPEGDHIRIVITDSNPLIQPMSPKMPLLFNKELAMDWLNEEKSPQTIQEKASSLFLLTDLSVLRVSKDVNDPKNNNPDLIQPIPK